MKFGEYLKNCRTKKNIKLTKAAPMLGISTGYLSGIENGRRSAPSNDLLQKIADLLELNKKERFILYDLAAESKQPPALADDLVDYINQNLVIRDMLRYSMECQIKEKDWKIVFSFVKKNYFY